jgi:hypothetical protein
MRESECGLGSGDRKQRQAEFQGLTRNAKERKGIEKERGGMQRNSYCSLKAHSLSRFSQISSGVDCSPTAPRGKSASHTNLAARMALTMTSWREPRHSTLLEVRKASSSSSRFRLPGWNLGVPRLALQTFFPSLRLPVVFNNFAKSVSRSAYASRAQLHTIFGP